LQTLNLNPDSPLDQQQAEEITHALIDWIDVDSEITGSGGAERGYYADLDLPYRPADQALLSVSELRWVKGIDDKLYRSLEPHITALKPGTRININTAGLNVLRSFNEDGNLQPIAEFDAQAIIRDRDGDPEAGTEQMKSGFDDLQAFVSSHPATALNPDSMSVTSEYFLVDSHSVFMGRSYRLYSVLHRGGDGHVKTIARASSGLGACSGNQ
jgi:general secretion pathway protein K